MREDFTVVLECRAPQPVTRCHLGHWSWGSDGMNWDELDAVNARLSETGDGALEVGHGGSGTLFYWDVDASAPGFCRTPPIMSDTAYSSPFSFPSWLKAR